MINLCIIISFGAGLPFMILANKADKIAITKVDETVNKLQKEINPICDAIMLPFSSQKKIYTETIWKEIEKKLKH